MTHFSIITHGIRISEQLLMSSVWGLAILYSTVYCLRSSLVLLLIHFREKPFDKVYKSKHTFSFTVILSRTGQQIRTHMQFVQKQCVCNQWGNNVYKDYSANTLGYTAPVKNWSAFAITGDNQSNLFCLTNCLKNVWIHLWIGMNQIF